MSLRRICTLSLLGLLLTRVGAGATTVLQLDLADLSSRASRIFVGRCLSSTPVQVGGALCTSVDFEILETVKGNRDLRETILFAGGQIDGVRQQLAGMPTFKPGEEAVLFLTAPDSHGRSWPIGLAQGKFGVVRNASGKPMVVRGENGVHRGASPGAARPAAPLPRRQPLRQFLDQVRKLAGPEQGGPNAR